MGARACANLGTDLLVGRDDPLFGRIHVQIKTGWLYKHLCGPLEQLGVQYQEDKEDKDDNNAGGNELLLLGTRCE